MEIFKCLLFAPSPQKKYFFAQYDMIRRFFLPWGHIHQIKKKKKTYTKLLKSINLISHQGHPSPPNKALSQYDIDEKKR